LVNERYAIETRYVREVGPLVDVTPVPGTPEFVRGVGNLRGEITAIIELGRFFGIGTQSRTDLSRLVVLGAERVEFGIVADDVREVISLPIETLSALDMATTRVDRTYLRGVTTDALIVLDGAALLNDHRLMIDHDRGSLAVAPNGRLQ
jgi:purine-binding chemotaxis protein CheW